MRYTGFVPPPAASDEIFEGEASEIYDGETESAADALAEQPSAEETAVHKDSDEGMRQVSEHPAEHRSKPKKNLLFPRGISSEDLLIAGLMLLLRGEENTEDIMLILGFLLIS